MTAPAPQPCALAAHHARGDAMVAEWRELAQAHGLHVVGDTTRVVLRCERCGVRFDYSFDYRAEW